MSAYTAASTEGRILMALRAGAMTTAETWERFPSAQKAVADLARQRLVAKDGDGYRLTPAGRAACPFRNPLLAGLGSAPAQPEETVMNKKITAEQVLAHIVAAGPRGTTVTNLSIDLGVSDQTIFNQRKKIADKFFIRGRGVMVANQFAETPETTAAQAAEAALEDEVKKIEAEYAGYSAIDDLSKAVQETLDGPDHPGDQMIDFDIEAAQSIDVTAESPSLPPSPRQQAWADDIIIDDPDMAEFALFSSGGLDIYYQDSTVSMTAPVLRKLRDFIGLFQEAA